MKLLVLSLVILISSTVVATNTLTVRAQGGSIRLHEIAKPPNIKLDSSFNPASVFNPAVTPVGGAPFCSSGSLGTILCYPPAFVKKAYDFPTTVTGTGQTIVIVDAFGSPTIQADLNTYDSMFGVTPTTITKLCPPTFSGLATDTCPDTTTDFTDGSGIGAICDATGWGEETTLDVTQAHGLAPGAKIVLVEAATCFDVDLNAAEQAVVSQLSLKGSIMSQSFGEPDDLVGCNYLPCNITTPGVFDPTIRSNYNNIMNIAQSNGWTVLASSGDDGANEAYSAYGVANPGQFGELTPSYPATNPNVLGIGGSQGQSYGGQYGTSNPSVLAFPPGPSTPPLACAAGATCNTGLVTMTGGTSGCQTANRPGIPTGCSPTGYGGEGTWQEYNTFQKYLPPGARSSSGGGFSYNYYLNSETSGNFTFMQTYSAPSYQNGLASSYALTNGTLVSRSGRATPDVSFDSAVVGGVLAYVGFSAPLAGLPRWEVIGGTSASSPAWAAIIALVNQVHGSPVGYINQAIYELAQSNLYTNAFHDIKVGNNTDSPGITQNGFLAGPGWDPTTGWGTPDVANFVNDIQPFIGGPNSAAYAINLVQGWNLVSLPLIPVNTAINTALGSLVLSNEAQSVWSYQGGFWKFATLTAGRLSGSLLTVQDGAAYWIYMGKADTLWVNGYVIPPASSPPSYSLAAGWNMIGFKPQPSVVSETVSAYLTSLGTKYDPNNVWLYDNPSGTWTRAAGSTSITPGQGIWIFMTSAATLYP